MTQGDKQSSYNFSESRKVRRGFTLVELLVVIAIIGILVALLLPAIQAARDAARRSQCSNQLKQIGLAILNYENSNQEFPAGATSEGTDIVGPFFSTWSVDILPYMEEQALYDLWVQDEPIGSPTFNREIRETIVQAYICPTDVGVGELVNPQTEAPLNALLWAPGSYRAVSGYASGEAGNGYWDSASGVASLPFDTRGPIHTILENPGDGNRRLYPVKIAQITDGTSKTLLAGEYHTVSFQPRRTLWSYPYTSYNQSSGIPYATNLLADYDRCGQIDLGDGGINNCKRAWGSLHGGGVVQFAQCDGSVQTISNDIDMNIFAGRTTIAGADETGRGGAAPPIVPPPR